MSEIVKRVERAMTRYAEGSEITPFSRRWQVYDTVECSFVTEVYKTRALRDARIRELNARAAIEAMREPTSEMIEEGRPWAWDYRDEDAVNVWQSMIDAALSDEQNEQPEAPPSG